MLKKKIERKILNFFRGKKFFYNREKIFSEHTLNFERVQFFLRAFYGYSFFLSLDSFRWMSIKYENAIFYDPLWVFGSLSSESIYTVFHFLIRFQIVASLLAFLFPLSRSTRALQAISLFFIVAAVNSDGHFGHNVHGMVWISLILILLPRVGTKVRQTRVFKHRFIMTFWFAQLAICTFYLMTGYWKVKSIGECIVFDDLVCQLDHKILTNISAREALSYFEFAPFRDLFFKYPWVAFWSYMGTIWIHLVSLHFLFRIDLHRVFGFFRLIFHIGTFLFFGVNFSQMAAPVALIFICSPFDRGLGIGATMSNVLNLPPFSWAKILATLFIRRTA